MSIKALLARLGTRRVDWVLLGLVGILCAVGLALVYSASANAAFASDLAQAYYFRRQFVWVVLGWLGLFLLSHVPLRFWKSAALPVMVAVILLLTAVLILGDERFGATRTLFAGSILPAEFAKLGVIIFLAAWLAGPRKTFNIVAPALLLGITIALIMLEPNFADAFLILLIAVAMFLLVGFSVRRVALIVLVVTVSFALLSWNSGYVWTRVQSFLGTLTTPGASAELNLIAIASGGVLGRGLGNGVIKGAMPLAFSDYILGVAGEELGLVGILALLALFAVVFRRGFRIAARANDAFGFLLAAGISSWIMIQVLVCLAAVSGIIPFVGVSFPFCNYSAGLTRPTS